MELGILDISVFALFFLIVVGTSMYKSRKEETGEDYFLASRSLIWTIIGISLIAANITSEQFVGMSGQSAGNVRLAIASYVAQIKRRYFFHGRLHLPHESHWNESTRRSYA